MLGDRGLCERQFVHDVAAHPRFLLREHPQNPDPRGMANGFGKGGQLVVSCRSFNRSCEQLNGLLLRWAADRRFGLASLSVRNRLGRHRQSSINDNTTQENPSTFLPNGAFLGVITSLSLLDSYRLARHTRANRWRWSPLITAVNDGQ